MNERQGFQMQRMLLGGLVLTLISGFALAHSGVMNPAVKNRMNLMVEVRDATAVIGKMAKTEVPFDAAAAERARLALVEHAKQIPALFEPNERDPNDEAQDAIWENWADFVAKAKAMEVAAAEMDTSSLDMLRQGLAGLGQSCSGCHDLYRVKK